MREPSVVRVSPAHRDVWQAKQAQDRPYLPLALRVAFGMLLLCLTYYLFPGTEDGTFFREIVVAALGAVITVFAAAAVAIGPLRRLWRERRESSARVAFDAATWQRSSIQIGRMKIPDIVVVASADHGREWTDGVDLRFTDLAEPRADAPEMASLREHRLPLVVPGHQVGDTRLMGGRPSSALWRRSVL